MPNLPTMNLSQTQAIQHGKGPLLLLAGPGSGKTTVITHRIQHLIQVEKVTPEEILVITFTKAAALEMQERFQKLSQSSYFPVNFGTFHAVFYHILQENYHFQPSNIITEQERYTFLRTVLEQIPQEEEEMGVLEADFTMLLLAEIGKVKNQGTSITEYKTVLCKEEVFRRIYQDYCQMMRQNRKIDFEDMLLLCDSLLQKKPEVLKEWQRRYRYILIDEFQDINEMQYHIIKKLAFPENNLFVVGDDDQSIYGFRGSTPELMQRFLKEYEAKQLLLNVNYRCSPSILQASLAVINENKNRFYKDIISGGREGDSVYLHEFPSKEAEMENMIHLIRQYGEKHSLLDIAVIYRTHIGAGGLIEKLVEKQIPFVAKEKINSIYQHFIARDIRAYLGFALEKKREQFYKIMNKPIRYLARAAAREEYIDYGKLLTHYIEKPYMRQRIQKLQYDMNAICQMNPYAAINYIRKGIGYEIYLKKLAEEKRSSLQEWLAVLDELKERAKGYATIEEWFSHIDSYEQELKQQKTAPSTKEAAVTILTMHGAKGLEYPIVILPDSNEGVIPHKKADLPEQLEEERRMFYVAMTRAKEKLFIFWTVGSKDNPILPSRYLNQINSSCSVSDKYSS